MSEQLQQERSPRAGINWMWLAALLMLAILASALGVIYTAHSSRDLFRALEQARHDNNEIQLEWRQLLLERSSLSSQARVENIARSELQMDTAPDKIQVMVIE